jgi:hypothetical protein
VRLFVAPHGIGVRLHRIDSSEGLHSCVGA